MRRICAQWPARRLVAIGAVGRSPDAPYDEAPFVTKRLTARYYCSRRALRNRFSTVLAELAAELDACCETGFLARASPQTSLLSALS